MTGKLTYYITFFITEYAVGVCFIIRVNEKAVTHFIHTQTHFFKKEINQFTPV